MPGAAMSTAVDPSLAADPTPAAFAEALARAEHDKGRTVATREGRPVAVLVPIEDVETLDAPTGGRIRRALLRLAADPHTVPNVTAMQGGSYRLRVGGWRAVYALEADKLLVLVLRVGHRREVYR